MGATTSDSNFGRRFCPQPRTPCRRVDCITCSFTGRYDGYAETLKNLLGAGRVSKSVHRVGVDPTHLVGSTVFGNCKPPAPHCDPTLTHLSPILTPLWGVTMHVKQSPRVVAIGLPDSDLAGDSCYTLHIGPEVPRGRQRRKTFVSASGKHTPSGPRLASGNRSHAGPVSTPSQPSGNNKAPAPPNDSANYKT